MIADGPPSGIVTEELMRRLYNVEVRIESLFLDKVRVCVPEVVVNGHRDRRFRPRRRMPARCSTSDI